MEQIWMGCVIAFGLFFYVAAKQYVKHQNKLKK